MARNALVTTLIFVLASQPARAANFTTGPKHVAPAWNIYNGGLVVAGQGSFYTKHDVFTGANGIESGVTVWDSQTSAAIYWGLTPHWELGLVPIISQKNHATPTGSDVPGDLLLSAKFGSIGPVTWPVKMAFQFDTRLPFARHHNIPLHPYSAAAFGYGGQTLFSINSLPKTPQSGFAWDFNFGWFNHNDAGLKLTDNEFDTVTAKAATQELFYGTAARLMGQKFGLFVEVFGRQFLQPPPVTAYTRANSLYLTPGLIYQFNPWIQLLASADIMLQTSEDVIANELPDGAQVWPWRTVPNQPDWRFNLGLSFRLREGKPAAAKVKAKKAEKTAAPEITSQSQDETEKRKKTVDKKEIQELERRLKEQAKTPAEESEAEKAARVEAERQRMQEILEQLRKAMEETKNGEDSKEK